MIITKALKKHPKAQCTVRIHTPSDTDTSVETLDFSSNGLLVLTMKAIDGKLCIKSYGAYDSSAHRHLKWFLEEYIPDIATRDIQRIVVLGYIPLKTIQSMHTEHTSWR